MSTNHELARAAAEKITLYDEVDDYAAAIEYTYAPAMAELAMYEKLFRAALCNVDRVFQSCGENPNPILPDFCKLGEDKFVAVVRLAEKYAQQEAEIERLRRQVEHAKRSGVKYQPGFCAKQQCVRCYLCGYVEICEPNETRPQTYARMTHHQDCINAKDAT